MDEWISAQKIFPPATENGRLYTAKRTSCQENHRSYPQKSTNAQRMLTRKNRVGFPGKMEFAREKEKNENKYEKTFAKNKMYVIIEACRITQS